ncbi:MAG TPA: hypothetical protein VF260_01260 [Bacilli bacterium]
MQNIYWYCMFIFVGSGIMIYVIHKKKNAGDIIAFWLAEVALVFIGEIVVLFMFEGYRYKTELFADPFANNVIGHVIPNIFLWGTAGVLVGACRLSYRWIAALVAVFMSIEWFFLKAGLYEHYWWRLYMTLIAISLYLLLARKLYAVLARGRYAHIRNAAFVLIGIVVLHTPSIGFLLLDMQFYDPDWTGNIYRDSILFGVFYHGLNSAFAVMCFRRLHNVLRILLPMVVLFFFDAILYKLHILILENGMNMWGNMIAGAGSIVLFSLLERYTLRLKAKTYA